MTISEAKTTTSAEGLANALESQINAARENLDKMLSSPESAEKVTVPLPTGLMATLNRCQGKLYHLNERLTLLAERVGSL